MAAVRGIAAEEEACARDRPRTITAATAMTTIAATAQATMMPPRAPELTAGADSEPFEEAAEPSTVLPALTAPVPATAND